jgi:hypothetical protein
MTEQPGHPYYLQRREKLLAEHRNMAAVGREIVRARYGEAFADTLLGESLSEFKKLIPELPYFGGKQNLLTTNLIRSTA